MEIPTTPQSAALPAPLSPQRCRSYHQLTRSIVQYMTAQYAAFLHSDRAVDATKWKLLKTREKITIYRARSDNLSDELSKAGVRPPSSWQPQAKLLCVGTIRGSLDDAMYGAITPTQSSMAARSLYIGDEFVAHRVVQDIELPTAAEPFRYLGLKWAARSPSLAAIIRPRDSVYIEASGMTTMAMADGHHERIGYVVYESVDLPQLEASLRTSDRMVRARASACYLFRQASPNVVELHAVLVSSAGGSVPPKLAALSGAAVMISVARVVDCALKKKLVWMRKSHAAHTAATDLQPVSKKLRGRECSICERSLKPFSSVAQCKICYTKACSRCITARSLVVAKAADSKLARESTPMCKSCVASALHANNGAELATREFVLQDRPVAAMTPPNSLTASRIDRSASATSSTSSTHFLHSSYRSQPLSQPNSPSTETLLLSSPLLTNDLDDLDEEMVIEVPPQAMPPVYNEKTELWMRMNALRMQAEHTFLVVSQQAQAQSHAQHQPPQALRRSELD